jgi:hypothetical protein
MARYFPSKVDTWYYLTIVLSVGAIVGSAIAVWMVEPEEAPLAMMILVPVGAIALGLPLWLLKTGYTLEPTQLLVKSGPMKWVVPLADIRSIEPTRNPLSSPALSLDRLLISYGKHGRLMISPADKEGFLRELEALRGQLAQAGA